MNFVFFLIASVAALNTDAKVADVIKSIEAATQRQEAALKTTTQRLRALQERVNALVPHGN